MSMSELGHVPISTIFASLTLQLINLMNFWQPYRDLAAKGHDSC